MFPDWVEKFHTKGTTIKCVRGSYYLYKSTSKRVEGKPYPVSIQEYIGRITQENGLIEGEKITFKPEVDELLLLKKAFDDIVSKDDLKVIGDIPLLKVKNNYYVGRLTNKQLNVIKSYFQYKNGKIWR